MRGHTRAAIVLILTLGLLALFLRHANLGQVWSEIQRSRPELIVASLVITLVTYLLRAFRWQYLLRPIGPTRFSSAFRTTVIGFAATFLLPARAGEFFRPYLLARWEGLNATATFATIILERLLDLVTVLLLLAGFLLLSRSSIAGANPQIVRVVEVGGLLAACGALVALLIVFVLAGHPEALGRSALRIERLLPPRPARAIARFVEMFVGGLAVMRQPRRLLMALMLSFPLWVSIATGAWLASLAFHITFPFVGSFLVMAILVIGVAMPTPGAVGGFHEAYRFATTTFFAAPNDRAVGAAIVLHGLSFLPVTVLGILFMARAGLSLRGVHSLAQTGANGSPAPNLAARFVPDKTEGIATPLVPVAHPRIDDQEAIG